MKFLGSLFVFALAGTAAAAPTAPSLTLTPEGAHQALAAALSYAKVHAAPGGAVAIVDSAGTLLLFERLEGTFPAASRVAIGKAHTAATFAKPTKFFEDVINKGRFTMTALPDFTPLQGGVPILVDGKVAGAVGVSGAASAQQDEEIALAGAAALTSPAPAP